MREIQDMTLNVSRGLERLERQLSERSERFRQEFKRLRTPENAWGVRLTAALVGDEIRIERVFRQHGLAEEFKEPWHRVLYRQGDQAARSLKGLEEYYGTVSLDSWKPRLRATRAESNFISYNDLHLPYNSYRELHCDGLIELGHLVSVDEWSSPDFFLPPDLPVYLFANLAVWADHVRKQSRAPTAEYALEVEVISIGGPVMVSDPNSDQHHLTRLPPPTLQPGTTTFPKYPLGNPTGIPDLLAVFHRDFWNSLGIDREHTFSIQDWPG